MHPGYGGRVRLLCARSGRKSAARARAQAELAAGPRRQRRQWRTVYANMGAWPPFLLKIPPLTQAPKTMVVHTSRLSAITDTDCRDFGVCLCALARGMGTAALPDHPPCASADNTRSDGRATYGGGIERQHARDPPAADETAKAHAKPDFDSLAARVYEGAWRAGAGYLQARALVAAGFRVLMLRAYRGAEIGRAHV